MIMKKILLTIFVLIMSCNTLIANEKKYDHKTCSQIYNAVGYFLGQADFWKKANNEEKTLE